MPDRYVQMCWERWSKMLISHSNKFIFVHIYKVAGQSVRAALAEYAYFPGGPFGRIIDRAFHFGLITRMRKIRVHSTAAEVAARLPPDVFNSYFKFSFVRNPWDWQVSLYHFMKSKPLHRQNRLARRLRSFDEYIEWRVANELRLQKSFVTDANGKLLVDFVGKLETIDADFATICRKVGITATLPHVNRSAHRPFQEYYNAHTRELVRRHFAEDIECFGYTFD